MITTVVFVASLAFVHIGCERSSGSIADNSEGRRMRIFARLYLEFVVNNGNQNPANEQQLKDYIRSLSPELLDRLGGVSVDEYFISDRDGQPLVVLYGNKVGGSQRTGVVAYEQEGKDGTRLVAFQLGGVKALDQAELQELLGNPVSQR